MLHNTGGMLPSLPLQNGPKTRIIAYLDLDHPEIQNIFNNQTSCLKSLANFSIAPQYSGVSRYLLGMILCPNQT